MRPLLPATLLFLIGAILSIAAEPTRKLTTAAEIRSLSVAEAASGIDAVIRGVVIFVESASGIFIQDETSTTFFRSRLAPDALPAVGDELELEAKTRMGLYLPGLDYPKIKYLGRRPVPPGIPATYDDLFFARYHYRRVMVEGIIRSIAEVEERGTRKSLVRLALGSRVIEARVETPPLQDRALVDHRVRITGLAAGFINDRRQLVAPYLGVVDWSDVEVVAPAPPATEVPRISAEQLLAFRVSGHGEQRIRIEGTVTAAFTPTEIFLSQGVWGFAVRLARATPITPGDQVAVVGFPEMERFNTSVVDAEVVEKKSGPDPAPVDLSGPDALAGPFDGMLVRLPATVRDVSKIDGGFSLLLAGSSPTVHVRLPEATSAPPIGAIVSATGICQVESAKSSTGFTSRPGVVSVRMRTAADLEILREPSWWTPRRLAFGLGTLAGVTLLAGLWIAVLRRQVARQTAALGARIQSEAALAERQRIAREFHDTLEQELAGVSLRLDAVATRPLDDKGRNLISAARNLVSRIQTETRDLISDLRDSAETAGDLAAALASVAARHAADSGAEVRCEISSAIPPLPAAVVHDLRMIARESVTNALKHGRASHIRIELAAANHELHLRIVDNGCGFDPATTAQPRRGHFGCAGIRERARKIGAEVTWQSELQRGTTVQVALTLPLQDGRNERPARPPSASPVSVPSQPVAPAHLPVNPSLRSE